MLTWDRDWPVTLESQVVESRRRVTCLLEELSVAVMKLDEMLAMKSDI